MTAALWILGAYLLGAVPASYLAGRLGGRTDLREYGSGNLGATNVYRVLGWKFAAPVAAFDVAKGALPVLLAGREGGGGAWLPLAAGVAAVTGHVFPIYMRFRGGKGVATAAGVVLALEPAAFGASAVVWIAILLSTRYVSLASLLGAVSFPAAVALVGSGNRYVLATSIVLAAFIVYTHRTNIRRLRSGTEHRFGRRPGGASDGS